MESIALLCGTQLKYNIMKTSIKIKIGQLGYILIINGKKVNFSSTEFCTIGALRKYWNHYRVLLSGFRHDNLNDYLKANAQAGN